LRTLGKVKSLSTKSKLPKTEYDHALLREICDTYTDGVFAVLALINECRWDPSTRTLKEEVKYEIGRRMTTSASNRVSRENVVTPDCVIQMCDSNGLVAEAKLGLPRNDQTWDEHIKQLEKYDDDLTGWWTNDERLAVHDLIALVPLSRAVRFADHLEKGVSDGKWKFDRKIAVVGSFKTSGVKDFLSLKKERGDLSTAGLNERLREGKQVEMVLLILKYEDRKFVDHMPPLPYLLQILWDHLFTRYAGEHSEDGVSASHTIEVSVERVTRDLQDYFGFKSGGSRSPEIPRSRWVRKALDTLALSRLATKVKEGEYIVRYKRTRGDTLKKFGKICFELDQRIKPPPENQLPLLSALPPTE
jgi:hypothetical protein